MRDDPGARAVKQSRSSNARRLIHEDATSGLLDEPLGHSKGRYIDRQRQQLPLQMQARAAPEAAATHSPIIREAPLVLYYGMR